MRFMVIVKASEDSEKGVLPTEQELTEMGAYNEELVKAGVMLAGEGLHPQFQGGPGPVRQGRQQHGDRRAVRRDQGARRGLLDPRGVLARGGPRVGQEGARSATARSRCGRSLSAEDFGDALTPSCASRRTGCAPPPRLSTA